MSYIPIIIDRKSLTIMDVLFPDLETLEIAAEAIGTNMFEGYQPTRRGIEIIRDYCLGRISFMQLINVAKDKSYMSEKPYLSSFQ